MKSKPVTDQAFNSSYEDRFPIARSYLRSVGVIFSIYSSAIRAINSAGSVLKTQDDEAINNFAVRSAYTPISISPTLTQAFRLATAELYPEEYKNLSKSGTPKLKETLLILNANEIAAILGITYFFKLLSKSCNPSEFNKFAPIFSSHLKLGGLVGSQTGSKFGRGGGIAAAGLRCLAIAILMKVNLKAFKGYRKLIDESGILSHSSYELQNFGCTHLDLASLLAGELGFGPVAREAYIALQLGRSKYSTSEGINWNHSLSETTKLWAARKTLKNPENKVSSINNQLEGYHWLWSQLGTVEVLPGINSEEISKLIPESNSQMQPLSDRTESEEPTTNLSILIVEDENSSARLLERHIKALGNVTICESAEAAMSLLTVPQQSVPFDLILLDVGLPGMSGLELLNTVREMEQKMSTPEDARSKILMITGDENPQTVTKAFSHGADGYLTKPLKREEIKQELVKHHIILGDKA